MKNRDKNLLKFGIVHQKDNSNNTTKIIPRVSSPLSSTLALCSVDLKIYSQVKTTFSIRQKYNNKIFFLVDMLVTVRLKKLYNSAYVDSFPSMQVLSRVAAMAS